MMDFAVTIGTHSTHELRVIWSSVCQSTDMVRFQIGNASERDKRRPAAATLTKAVCSRLHVLPDRLTA